MGKNWVDNYDFVGPLCPNNTEKNSSSSSLIEKKWAFNGVLKKSRALLLALLTTACTNAPQNKLESFNDQELLNEPQVAEVKETVSSTSRNVSNIIKTQEQTVNNQNELLFKNYDSYTIDTVDWSEDWYWRINYDEEIQAYRVEISKLGVEKLTNYVWTKYSAGYKAVEYNELASWFYDSFVYNNTNSESDRQKWELYWDVKPTFDIISKLDNMYFSWENYSNHLNYQALKDILISQLWLLEFKVQNKEETSVNVDWNFTQIDKPSSFTREMYKKLFFAELNDQNINYMINIIPDLSQEDIEDTIWKFNQMTQSQYPDLYITSQHPDDLIYVLNSFSVSLWKEKIHNEESSKYDMIFEAFDKAFKYEWEVGLTTTVIQDIIAQLKSPDPSISSEMVLRLKYIYENLNNTLQDTLSKDIWATYAHKLVNADIDNFWNNWTKNIYTLNMK